MNYVSPEWGRGRQGARPEDSLLLRRALRRLRLQHGLTLAQAAPMFAMTMANLSRAETGARLPISADRIAKAYGQTAQEVLQPCARCGFSPAPGFRCLSCGSSQEDPHECPWGCGYQTGTDREISDHVKAAHTGEAKHGTRDQGPAPDAQGEAGGAAL